MFTCLCDCVSCMRVCLQRPESISLGTGVKGSVSADEVSGSQTGVLWKSGMLSQQLSRLSSHPTPFKTGLLQFECKMFSICSWLEHWVPSRWLCLGRMLSL